MLLPQHMLLLPPPLLLQHPCTLLQQLPQQLHWLRCCC
jgi:hypothetical protein